MSFYLYFLKHKFFVAYYALRFFHHVSLWQILVHDLDKLSNISAFANDYRRRTNTHPCHQLHRLSQPHHWEYWQGRPMPLHYRQEMLADWFSAARCKHGQASEAFDFYRRNRRKIVLDEGDRLWVEIVLKRLQGKI